MDEKKIIQIMPAVNWWASFKGKTYYVIGWALCEWSMNGDVMYDVFGMISRGEGVELCNLDTTYDYELP